MGNLYVTQSALIHWQCWKLTNSTDIIFTVLLASFVPMQVSLRPPGRLRTNRASSVYFCYPETSNLSLEEIDNLFLPDEHKVRAGSISNAAGMTADDIEKNGSSYHSEEKS